MSPGQGHLATDVENASHGMRQMQAFCPVLQGDSMRIDKGLKYGLATLTLGVAMSALPVHAQQVSSDYDHDANFEAYHTFSFAKVQTANPLYENRVKDAITQDLQAKGWQLVPSGGDIAITAIGDVKNQQEYTTFYNGLGPGFGWRGWGGWYGGGWGRGNVATTTAQTIPIGTLMVDLYDTRTNNLVFRGRATDQVHVKHTDKNIALVNKAVDKMFDKFPPKRK